MRGARASGLEGRRSRGRGAAGPGGRLVAVRGDREAAGVTAASSSVAAPAAWVAHGVPGSSSGARDTDL